MFANLRRTRSERTDYSCRSSDTSPDEAQQRSRRRSVELTRHRRTTINERNDSPPPQPLQKRLTNTLLETSQEQFDAATKHPFLRAAGQGKVSKHELSRWLSQDRLYAEAYVSFISSLIARVSLPFSYVQDKGVSLRWRIVELLTGCLENIQTEIQFFTDTAEQYRLRLDQPWDNYGSFGPNPVTEQYINLFTSFHLDPQQTLLEGLLVLWATEKCYLEAWTYASIHLAHDISAESDQDGGALRDKFIPNWSSKDFDDFVRKIADVTDKLAQREGALKKVEVFRALWLHVLEIEKGFWPEIDLSI